MPRYLIVGLPGVGKSTLTGELLRRGYDALDADWDEQLSLHAHRETGLMKRELTPQEAASGEFHWSWNGDRLAELLGSYGSGAHFILGNAANISSFYANFDKVFALVTDDITLADRIKGRGHGYGIAPAELDKILEWNKTFQAHEIERGAVIIDATPPTRAVAAAILAHCYA